MTRSASTQSLTDAAIRYPFLTTVDDQSDLTGIGTTTTMLLERWETTDQPIDIDFNSVADLLNYCDRETVFSFLHLFTRRVEQADATCYYRLDATACDESTERVFAAVVDDVVTVDDRDDVAPEAVR